VKIGTVREGEPEENRFPVVQIADLKHNCER
jgi:hypothetical protein